MSLQSERALNFFNALINLYKGLRRAVEGLISWSPALTRFFNETLTVGRWKVLRGGVKQLKHFLPNPIMVDGHSLFHHPTDINTTLSLGVDYEVEVREALKGLIKPGMTMVDAGANIGYYTMLGARAVGEGGHVYAFEPVPATAELLRKNVEANGYGARVTVVEKALGQDCSTVRLYTDEVHSGISSVLPERGSDPESGTGRRKSGFVDVEGETLDRFFSGLGWPPVDIIKMDIEGAEKYALRGMRELCRISPDLKLIVEVNLGFDIEPLFDALLECGFSRFYLLEEEGKEVKIPEEIERIRSASKGILVNLLCEMGT